MKSWMKINISAPANNSAAEEITTRLRNNFERFAEDRRPEGAGPSINPHEYRVITLQQSNRWMKEAHVLGDDGLTTKDTTKAFNQLNTDALKFDQYVPFLAALAKHHGINLNQLIDMMAYSEEENRSTASLILEKLISSSRSSSNQSQLKPENSSKLKQKSRINPPS